MMSQKDIITGKEINWQLLAAFPNVVEREDPQNRGKTNSERYVANIKLLCRQKHKERNNARQNFNLFGMRE